MNTGLHGKEKLVALMAVAAIGVGSMLAAPEWREHAFTEPDKSGPVIRITGNQGYDTLTLMEWEDGTTIDARGAHWSSFSWGRSVRHPTVNDTALNNYPIQIGADWVGAYPIRQDLYNYGKCPSPRPEKLHVIGGVIEGTQPLDATWKQSKAANGGGITLNGLNSVIEGMRLHNLHDPFVPLEGNAFTIKNCWVSYSRDDAIENDGFASGVIEDSLFEDNNCFYSARNTRPDSGRQAEAPGGGADSMLVIRNNLIGLANLPWANAATSAGQPGPGFGHFWKQGDPRNPKVELVNNIFFVPKPFPGCRPSRYDVIPQGLVRAEGNIVIWMGEGEYPFKHDGFKVLSGAEGLAYWNKAREEWIARHSEVARVQGDPGYDPEKHGSAEPPPAQLAHIAATASKQESL